MPNPIQGVALTVAVQATVRSGDADPTAGTIGIAIQKWKQGEAEDGYYYTGSAWQAAAAVVTSTQRSFHGHEAAVDATRMAGLRGWEIEARPADAGAIGPSTWYHVGSDQLGDILAAILADTDEIQGKLPAGDIAGEPTGSRAITIHTQVAGGTLIPQAAVSLWSDALHTNLVTRGTTDAAGDLDLSLDDAIYYYTAVKSLYTFVAGSFTVSADATHNVIGVAVAPAAPSSPDLCVIYGTVLDASGDPVASASVSASVVTPAISGGNQLHQSRVSTTTNANGYFELELVRGATVSFQISATRIDGIYLVPNAANQDITTWAEAA